MINVPNELIASMEYVFVRKDGQAMVLSVYSAVRMSTLGMLIGVYQTYPMTKKVKIIIFIELLFLIIFLLQKWLHSVNKLDVHAQRVIN